MMKAVVYYENGGLDVFEYTDVDIPAVGPNEVLIRNEYVSIEGGDLIAREIVPPERVPHVVGYQCAGEIVEVGAQVRNRSVGHKVVALVPSGSHAAWCSHAEYTVAAADMTWILAAGISPRYCFGDPGRLRHSARTPFRVRPSRTKPVSARSCGGRRTWPCDRSACKAGRRTSVHDRIG
jgi:threonine dehydrogenase-like Zn-dependent dehydrogenase